MVASMLVMPWFKLGALGGSGKFEIYLRSIHACGIDGTCGSAPMSMLQGTYPTLSVVAFWSNCALALALAYQAGVRVFGGAAGEGLTRIGYLLAVLCLLSTGAAGFMFGPQPVQTVSGTVVRTWGPALPVIA